MSLQIALDRMELTEAVRLAGQVTACADWIEVGTSLVKRYGMASVEAVVEAAGGTPVVADLKTVDDVATEFGMAFYHGASAATVLAAASDKTIDRAVEVAAEAGAQTVLDLLEVTDERRDALLSRLPRSVVFAAHIGTDAQAGGSAVGEKLGEWARGRDVAVAGGLALTDLPYLTGICPSARVIVGSAITRSTDPAQTAGEFAELVGGTP